MKRYALIGAAGYIAPRHMKAIKDTGGELAVVMDKSDSVGIIDSYFPETAFYKEFEEFERHVERLKGTPNAIEYVSIASPNYLHASHIRFALRHGANAICEKPLVLNPFEIDELQLMEQSTGMQVYNILQLRLHADIIALKQKVTDELAQNPNKIYDIDLTYLTSRGNWYFTSWKGNDDLSGGIATNIGVHFFDMISWIFGEVVENQVHIRLPNVNAGYMELKNARVRWFLSVDYDFIPDEIKSKGMRTYRSITVDGDEIEFSGGFTELHTDSYNHILNKKGFGLDCARQSIEIVSQIRSKPVIKDVNNEHPFINLVRSS